MFKIKLIAVLLALFCFMPGMSYALSDQLEFQVLNKSILSDFAQTALKEYYIYSPFEEKKLPEGLKFNSPILYTFKMKSKNASEQDFAAIVYKDSEKPMIYYYVLFKLQDGLVLEIVTRASVYTEELLKEIKDSAKSVIDEAW